MNFINRNPYIMSLSAAEWRRPGSWVLIRPAGDAAPTPAPTGTNINVSTTSPMTAGLIGVVIGALGYHLFARR
jgi:hypothetical protein